MQGRCFSRAWMSSGVGYTLQILGQKDTPPAVASLIMSLESVFAALSGWLVLGQSMNGRELLGCVLVFAAVILAQIPLETLKKEKSGEKRRHKVNWGISGNRFAVFCGNAFTFANFMV